MKVEYEIGLMAYAMRFLHLYCIRYQELIPELKIVLEEGMDLYSVGLPERGGNIFKSFSKIPKN